jgi:glycosyl transferase family 25
MRVLIINVAHATERMAFMQAQMQALGLQWERVEGVTPLTLSPPAEDPVWHRWQRPLRTTEMALCASHAAAWRRIARARPTLPRAGG